MSHFLGDMAFVERKNIMRTQSKFMSSCKLVELYATGNTTVADVTSPRITDQDGLEYTLRQLSLSVGVLTGLFMKMEQRMEYSG